LFLLFFKGGAVLVRAIEPIYGITQMIKLKKESTPKCDVDIFEKSLVNLTNGPSRLCQAMFITKSLFNCVDLCKSTDIWLQNDIDIEQAGINRNKTFNIIKSKRIGIDYAGEDAINKLYRFYIENNKFVSKNSSSKQKQKNN
jgi:DNA-3-methyladenine glycosylase